MSIFKTRTTTVGWCEVGRTSYADFLGKELNFLNLGRVHGGVRLKPGSAPGGTTPGSAAVLSRKYPIPEPLLHQPGSFCALLPCVVAGLRKTEFVFRSPMAIETFSIGGSIPSTNGSLACSSWEQSSAIIRWFKRCIWAAQTHPALGGQTHAKWQKPERRRFGKVPL